MTSEESLLAQHKPLVISIACRYRHRCVACEYEDVINAGMEGLLEAIRRFDPKRKRKFSTFATPCIRGHIQKWLRTQTGTIHIPDWVISERGRDAYKQPLAIEDIDPDDCWIAGESVDVLNRLLAEELLAHLDKRTRLAMRLRFWHGLGYKEIGTRLGITMEWSRVITKKGLAELREMLEEESD
jgi:RNA polymerase sigma factor (sigma-70 family)